jgi:RNA polymerase sigma-70 factor, ECF subfamily
MQLVAIGQPGGFGPFAGVGGDASVHDDDAPPGVPTAPASASRPRLSGAAEVRFRRMVDTQFDFIWRTLRGLGVPAANADDAAQQVFLVAAQKLDLITEGSERSFLFSTARGIAANARRARMRSREVLDDDTLAEPVSGAPDPEQLAARAQARELLGRILDGLAEDLRTVFVLFELEGMTTSQMAELLDVPMGTVASRLRRAREEFQAATKRFQSARGGK